MLFLSIKYRQNDFQSFLGSENSIGLLIPQTNNLCTICDVNLSMFATIWKICTAGVICLYIWARCPMKSQVNSFLRHYRGQQHYLLSTVNIRQLEITLFVPFLNEKIAVFINNSRCHCYIQSPCKLISGLWLEDREMCVMTLTRKTLL